MSPHQNAPTREITDLRAVVDSAKEPVLHLRSRRMYRRRAGRCRESDHRARALMQKAGIEVESTLRQHANTSGVRMQWVQEIVVLVRDHRGWNLENRGVATLEPASAQPLKSSGSWVATPNPRVSVRRDRLFLHLARHLDLDLNKVSWYQVLVRMDQNLESR